MTTACPACDYYRVTRGPRIRAEIAKTSTGNEADRRWRAFMAGVHRRHQAQPDPLRLITAGRFAALMALVTEDTRPKRGKRA